MLDSTASLFIDSARAVRTALLDDEVADRWNEPSVLPEMTIGALAAHLAGAVFTVERYLAQHDPEVTAHVETAVEYFEGALGGSDYHSGLGSEVQRGIRERAEEAAAHGAAGLLQRLSRTLGDLEAELADPPERITVFGGMSMPFDAYLQGRIVEMVVHLDDLDHSVSVKLPQAPDAAQSLTLELLRDLSVRRHGPLPIIRALSRRERAVDITAF